ncbi:MAG: hypothetical protein ACRCZS_13325 [Chroococcidiopsis sp.]
MSATPTRSLRLQGKVGSILAATVISQTSLLAIQPNHKLDSAGSSTVKVPISVAGQAATNPYYYGVRVG